MNKGMAKAVNADIKRLRDINKGLLEALRDIHKLWCCPPPKRLKDWSARCDVMADYARQALAKAEGR